MSKAPCLIVPKALGEKAIRFVKSLGLPNEKLKVQQVGDSLFIPIIREPLLTEKKEFKKTFTKFEIASYTFFNRANRHLKLVELLKDKLPSHLLESLPHAIDFVGKIAIIEIPLELEEHRNIVGESLLKSHRQVKTVLAKSSAVKGVYRLRKLDVIAGDDETEAIHKEYGCVFQLDLAKVFFSPRLAFEHNRVALQVRKGETVIDMFTGVGPFSIPIAKRYEETQVYAIDINPDAIFYLKKNIRLNNVEKNVTPVLGDAKQVIWERYVGIADRVIMNLPEKSIEYVRAACKTLKLEGGILHFYEFGSAPNPLEKTRDRLIKTLKQNKKEVKRFLSTRIVRATSPFTWQVVADVEVC